MQQIFKAIVFILLICGCNPDMATQNESFKIEGLTNGLINGTKIELVDKYSQEVYDSTNIINDKFEFTGQIENAPLEVLIQLKDKSQYKSFWLENEHLKFDASNSDLDGSDVIGSYSQYLEDSLYNILDTIEDDSISEIMEMKFVEDHANSPVGASILSFYSTSWEKEKVRILFNNLSEENKESIYGENVRIFLEINRNLKIGDIYADFEMIDEKLNKTRLSENLGRVTLLEFWSSWCGPCRLENPNLVKTYRKFHSKGFEIFAVSLDDDKDSWRKAITEDNLNWIHVCDFKNQNSQAELIYGINMIPDNFLINEKGKIIGRNLRGQELVNELNKLLN